MADIPEHLLARSRARRAALSGGSDEAAAAPSSTPAAASESPAAPTKANAPAALTAAEPSKPAASRVAPTATKRIPMWMIPVMAALPVWAFVYTGAFQNHEKAEEATPEGLYLANCAGCHAANGGGGTGPQLTDGEVIKTFPNREDHIAWVESGSAPFTGKPYGAADREGGQRVAETGGMPAFSGKLTAEEIDMVVTYEREVLGGAAAGE